VILSANAAAVFWLIETRFKANPEVKTVAPR